MAFSRYARAPILNFGENFGTSQAITVVRDGIKNGSVRTDTLVLRGAERLDTLAGSIYGDGRYWWLISIGSGIGWGLQVPAGTIITVPNLADVAALIG